MAYDANWLAGIAAGYRQIKTRLGSIATSRNVLTLGRGFSFSDNTTTQETTILGPVESVAAFGALGDGSDQTAALQAAAAYAVANKCAIIFPPGLYCYSSQLNFNNSSSVILEGTGTRNDSSGVELRYTGGGSGSAISAKSSSAFGIHRMKCTAVGGGFTGTLIDLTGSLAQPTSYAHFYEMGASAPGALLFATRNGFGHHWEKCNFSFCTTAVKGYLYGADFCNAYKFTTCSTELGGATVSWYSNPGQSWRFSGCIFEPILGGSSVGILSAQGSGSGAAATIAIAGGIVTVTGLSGVDPLVTAMSFTNFSVGNNNGTKTGVVWLSATSVQYPVQNGETLSGETHNGSGNWSYFFGARAQGLSIAGCWFGDSTTGGTDVNVLVNGLHHHGNYHADQAQGKTALAFVGTSTGVAVHGNEFVGIATGINWNNVHSGEESGNDFTSVTTPNSGNPLAGRIQASNNDALYGMTDEKKFTNFRFRYHRGAAQAINTSAVQVTLDTLDYDPNTSLSANGYSAPVAGYYQVNALVETDQTTGNTQATLQVSGSTISWGSVGLSNGANAASMLSDVVHLNAGDVLKLFVTSSVACNVIATHGGVMSVHYLSS